MVKNWAKYFSCFPCLPSAVLSKFLWFNSNIEIDKKRIFIYGFASTSINFVGQNIHRNGKTKLWGYIKSE